MSGVTKAKDEKTVRNNIIKFNHLYLNQVVCGIDLK